MVAHGLYYDGRLFIVIGGYAMNMTDDYHQLRRLQILKSHPQVRNLLKHEPKSIYLTIGLVVLQILLVLGVAHVNVWFLVLLAIFIGGPINFALFVLLHDAAHNAMSPSKTINHIIGLIANLPLLLPVAMSFKKYHSLHHRFLGVAKYDTDVPTAFENNYLLSNVFGKTVWFFLQPVFYGSRPLVVLPMKLNRWEIANLMMQVLFNATIYLISGFSSILFMLIAFYISLTCSPYFARYITEHYVRDIRQETSSYYGKLNPIICYFGLHVEHHDFPTMPWNNLPKLNKIANEFYAELDSFNSWTAVVFEFFSPSFNSRYHRVLKENSDLLSQKNLNMDETSLTSAGN